MSVRFDNMVGPYKNSSNRSTTTFLELEPKTLASILSVDLHLMLPLDVILALETDSLSIRNL